MVASVRAHLGALVDGHPDRHVGGAGNESATRYVEDMLQRLGWRVDATPFEALDWEHGPARLAVEGREFVIHPGPYTPPLDAEAPLAAVDTIAALEQADISDHIVLLYGDIARDQLFPRSFDFVAAPEHRHIYALLEKKRPLAVISATGRGSGMAGALYPYPLIEDGDFDIPNAYTTDATGVALLADVGKLAHLTLRSRRFAVSGRQLIARRGPREAPRVVVMAHIDSKEGSPGAVDNATGVASLLAVAEELAEYDFPYCLEIVPMNGEDHYAANGEHLFVAANEGRWQEIVLAINLDAVGGRGAGTAVSLYGCCEDVSAIIRRVMRRHPGTSIGEPWYESDHSIVAMHGRPAVALTSTTFRELCATVTHTERDTLDVVEPERVAAAARFVADVIRSLPAAGGVLV